MSEEKQMTQAEALKKNYVKPGSPEHKTMLEIGYGMSLDDAKIIVAEWEKDHKSWPLEEYRKAKAMIEAAGAVPVAVDKTPGWKRQRG